MTSVRLSRVFAPYRQTQFVDTLLKLGVVYCVIHPWGIICYKYSMNTAKTSPNWFWMLSRINLVWELNCALYTTLHTPVGVCYSSVHCLSQMGPECCSHSVKSDTSFTMMTSVKYEPFNPNGAKGPQYQAVQQIGFLRGELVLFAWISSLEFHNKHLLIE